MGNRDGAVFRALAPHQCGPGSILFRCYMWVEFIVGFRLAPKVFSLGSPVFLSLQKQTPLNSNSIWNQWMKGHFVEMPVLIPIYFILFIFLFLCFDATKWVWLATHSTQFKSSSARYSCTRFLCSWITK